MTPTAFADPVNPTAAELRRRAIHGNYRALIDTTDGGGQGLVPGLEVIAYADDGTRAGAAEAGRAGEDAQARIEAFHAERLAAGVYEEDPRLGALG